MNSEYKGVERRAPERFGLKKEISIGDLLAVAGAISGIFFAYSKLDTRVTVLEQGVVVQTATDKRQDEESQRYQARIEGSLSRIESKVDRLMEIRK